MSTMFEKTIFHAPGELSTWFKGWLRPPTSVSPLATTVPEREALLAEIYELEAR
jgi:hypothetical protein